MRCFAKTKGALLYRGSLSVTQTPSGYENNILDVLSKQWHAKLDVPEVHVTSRNFYKFQDELEKYKVRIVTRMRYANAAIFDGINNRR